MPRPLTGKRLWKARATVFIILALIPWIIGLILYGVISFIQWKWVVTEFDWVTRALTLLELFASALLVSALKFVDTKEDINE